MVKECKLCGCELNYDNTTLDSECCDTCSDKLVDEALLEQYEFENGDSQ